MTVRAWQEAARRAAAAIERYLRMVWVWVWAVLCVGGGGAWVGLGVESMKTG